MLSVIIPTVQKKLKVLNSLIKILSEDSSVAEILVINNKPEESLHFRRKKVRVITPQKNLFVNQSWNLGVDEIKTENFALLNDDILVCKNFCKKIISSEIFNAPDTGLVGMSTAYINQFKRNEYEELEVPKSERKLSFIPQNKILSTSDWGIAIFGKKENYYKIPKELKIIYGDNYLLKKNQENGKQNYSVGGLYVNHIHSSSSASPEYSSTVGGDIKNSKKIFNVATNSIKSPSRQDEYSITYRGQVCVIKIGEKITIFMKYRNGEELLPTNYLVQEVFAHTKDNDLRLVEKIVNDIIAQNKSCSVLQPS